MNEAVAAPEEANDVRPIIATSSGNNVGLYAFMALLAIGGVVLYNALSASEEADEPQSIFQPDESSTARIASPTPLVLPARFVEVAEQRELPDQADGSRQALSPFARSQINQAPVRVTQVRTNAAEIPPRPLPVAIATATPEPGVQPIPPQPQVVFENRTPVAPIARLSRSGEESERVSATRLTNPSRTIPQGTVIQAVLETALDSTQGGGARALVQRDVSSFDGTRVLIPRGSRLYGTYEANLQPGQKRALVQWTRLIRPDGVTIALDSPSSDPLGRAGVKGKVDSKFLPRLGNALLQTVLDVGVGLGINAATDGVIVALPGSTQNVQVADQQQFQPTLKVKHGTSVSVFVARDLDFSSVEP
ncbi:MAG: TrbI/VirB10 family protein [Erythrobacter sp.]